jgi:hypothetical protein
VEVLNCGVNGYSPLQELLLLRREVNRYQPDLVVLALFLDNDVAGCHPSLNTTANQSPSARLENGKLVFEFTRPEESHASYHREPIYSIRKCSATYRWLRAGGDRRAGAEAAGDGTLGNEIPTRHQLYSGASPAQWADAWAVMEQALLDLAAETESHGAKLLIVSVPCSQVADPNAWHAVLERRPAMREKTWDLEGPERRLAAFADQHHMLLCRPLAAFQEQVKEAPLFIGNVGHFNARGHAVMAASLAEFLKQQKLLPSMNGA